MVLVILGVFILSIYINHLMYLDKRFQESNKLEQLFRYRYYLAIPLLWVFYSIKGLTIHSYEDNESERVRGVLLWRLMIGSQQSKMKWYYTSEEVFSKLKK